MDGSRGARWLISRRGLLVFVVVSFLVVLGQVAFVGTRVDSRADLADVSWGFPARWISQDQASLDPPFPWVVGVSSPWEHPTSIDWTSLALDVAAVALVLAVFAWLVVRGAGALRRRLLPARPVGIFLRRLRGRTV